MKTSMVLSKPTFPHFHISLFSHYPRRMEDITVIPVVQRFGMTMEVNDNRCKMHAGKSGAVVCMKQLFLLKAGSIGMIVLASLHIGGGYQLFFAIAVKRTGLLVNDDFTKAEINHLSKLGKEKDKEGEYGELLFHAWA